MLAGDSDVHHTPYLTDKHQYTLARAVTSTILKPGDCLSYQLPDQLSHSSHVLVTPRQESLKWLQPKVCEVTDGQIYITNCSSSPISLKKSDHLADIRGTSIFKYDRSLPRFKIKNCSDTFQFQDLTKNF